jgi:hypothetical protein
MQFWVHSVDGELLTANGYPVDLGRDKVRLWPDKEAVLKHVKRVASGFPVRDLGNRVEVDLPANAVCPARTLAWTEFTVQ